MGNKANRNDYKSKPEQAKNHPIPGTRINKKARGFRVLFIDSRLIFALLLFVSLQRDFLNEV